MNTSEIIELDEREGCNRALSNFIARSRPNIDRNVTGIDAVNLMLNSVISNHPVMLAASIDALASSGAYWSPEGLNKLARTLETTVPDDPLRTVSLFLRAFDLTFGLENNDQDVKAEMRNVILTIHTQTPALSATELMTTGLEEIASQSVYTDNPLFISEVAHALSWINPDEPTKALPYFVRALSARAMTDENDQSHQLIRIKNRNLPNLEKALSETLQLAETLESLASGQALNRHPLFLNELAADIERLAPDNPEMALPLFTRSAIHHPQETAKDRDDFSIIRRNLYKSILKVNQLAVAKTETRRWTSAKRLFRLVITSADQYLSFLAENGKDDPDIKREHNTAKGWLQATPRGYRKAGSRNGR